MLTIYIRTIIIYFALIISIRVMGKRQIGELQISEFIITVLLSEIAAAPITNRSTPLLYAILPILLLLSIELIMSYCLLKSTFLRRLFYGTPTILIERGKIVQSALKANRIELDELLSELRLKGYPSVDSVRYAILEENGKLSVVPNSSDAPLTPKDASISTQDSGIAHALIIDGYILKENLTLAGWDEKKLTSELKHRKVSAEDVFLLSVDDCGKVCFIRKDSL